MLRIKNFTSGKIYQNIYGHFINYLTKREVFVNYDNLPEERPRQDVNNTPSGSGYMSKGWIRWNSEPSPTTPVGWVVYDENPTNLKWIPFYGESSGNFNLSAIEIDSAQIFYSIIGKQVLISGYIQFNTVDTDVNFTFPPETNIKPNYGIIYNLGDLTLRTINNSNDFVARSSTIGYQNIQISFMLP